MAILTPAPLSGYWHTPLSDCLCDSKNLLKFENGTAYTWASAHGVVKAPAGSYRRGIYTAEWNSEEGKMIIWPNWFFMKITVDKSVPYLGGNTYWGYRELSPSYISYVLKTEKTEPNKALEPTTMPVTFRAYARTAPGMVAAQF